MFRTALAHCEKMMTSALAFVTREAVHVFNDVLDARIDARADQRPASAGGKPIPTTGHDVMAPIATDDMSKDVPGATTCDAPSPEDTTPAPLTDAGLGAFYDELDAIVAADAAESAVETSLAADADSDTPVATDATRNAPVEAAVAAPPIVVDLDIALRDTGEAAPANDVAAPLPQDPADEIIQTSTIKGAAFFFQPTATVPDPICRDAQLVAKTSETVVSFHLLAGSRIAATWSRKPMGTAPEKIHAHLLADDRLFSPDVAADGTRVLLRNVEVASPGLAAALVNGGGAPAKRWVSAAGKPITDKSYDIGKRVGYVSFDAGKDTIIITDTGVKRVDSL